MSGRRQDRRAARQECVRALPLRRWRWLTGGMSDLLYLVLTLGFFGLAVGLVRLCDHVIGPDEEG